MILSELDEDEVGVIDSVDAPDNLRSRASHMGIIRGVEFRVFSKCGGDTVITLMGVKLALGRRLADSISVVPQRRARK